MRGAEIERQHDNAPRERDNLGWRVITISSWRAAIGIMGRIAVPAAGMRITIAGMRIRISAGAGARRQGVRNSWLNPPALSPGRAAKYSTEAGGS